MNLVKENIKKTTTQATWLVTCGWVKSEVKISQFHFTSHRPRPTQTQSTYLKFCIEIYGRLKNKENRGKAKGEIERKKKKKRKEKMVRRRHDQICGGKLRTEKKWWLGRSAMKLLLTVS